MALLAYNKTTVALALAAGQPTAPVLPPSNSAGEKGQSYNVTSELKGLSNQNYVDIQDQLSQGLIELVWSGEEEYGTGPLIIPSTINKIIDDSIDDDNTTTDSQLDSDIVYTKHISLEDNGTGNPEVITIYNSQNKLLQDIRILSVTAEIVRGSKDSFVQLIPGNIPGNLGNSDMLDTSSPGIKTESVVRNRNVLAGESLYLYRSTDYVLGDILISYKKN